MDCRATKNVTIHTYARFRINLRLSSVNCNDDAHKMPKNRHFGAGSDTMQQVHGAGVNSNQKTRRIAPSSSRYRQKKNQESYMFTTLDSSAFLTINQLQ